MFKGNWGAGFKIGLATIVAAAIVMFLISSIVYFSAYQEDHSNERQSDAEYQAKIGNNSPGRLYAHRGKKWHL